MQQHAIKEEITRLRWMKGYLRSCETVNAPRKRNWTYIWLRIFYISMNSTLILALPIPLSFRSRLSCWSPSKNYEIFRIRAGITAVVKPNTWSSKEDRPSNRISSARRLVVFSWTELSLNRFSRGQVIFSWNGFLMEADLNCVKYAFRRVTNYSWKRSSNYWKYFQQKIQHWKYFQSLTIFNDWK